MPSDPTESTEVFIKPTDIIAAGICAVTPPLIYAAALSAVGFTTSGVAYGSAAAGWMSFIGNVPAGSLYAALQSAGTLGVTGLVFSPAALAFEVAIFSATLYGINRYHINLKNISNIQDKIDFTRKHSIHLFENTRIYTEKVIKNAGDHLPSIMNQVGGDIFQKHAEFSAIIRNSNARTQAENTIKVVSSQFQAILTTENIDFIQRNTKETASAFIGISRVYAENATKAAEPYISSINSQEKMNIVRKHAEETVDNVRTFTGDAIKVTGSLFEGVKQKSFYFFKENQAEKDN